jgi:anti-sigma regulatory factor (Ser/Thr protein kinase)
MTAAAVAEHPSDTTWHDMPCQPESVGVARRAVRACLTSWGLEGVSEDAELLISELAGNAARHSGSRSIRLHISLSGAILRVGVRDSSRSMPVRIATRDNTKAENGRGLDLVHQLSHRWGVDLEPRGKIVWFELVVPQYARLGARQLR